MSKRYTIYGNSNDLDGVQEAIDLVIENERLNNIIDNMEEELMTIYLDIMEYNEDYAKREIKKLKGVDKDA